MHDHGAVILVPERERSFVVLSVGALGLFGSPGLAIQAHELLDMLGGAVQIDFEQVGFVLGGRDAGQGSDLGVAELTLGHGLGEQGKLGKGAGDADLLAGGVRVDAARPAQPVGAGECALPSPHFAPVELGDEGEEAPGCSVDVGGQGGDRGGKCVVVQMSEFNRHCRLEGSHEYTIGELREESKL